jgi:hypothetical protein
VTALAKSIHDGTASLSNLDQQLTDAEKSLEVAEKAKGMLMNTLPALIVTSQASPVFLCFLSSTHAVC